MGQAGEIKFQVKENKMALAAGAIAIAASVGVLVLRLLHPSEQGGGALLYLPLVLMAAAGVYCCMSYFCRRLTIDNINLTYVNSMGRKKVFTLDGIGYCEIAFFGGGNSVKLYDLTGDRICKLDFNMENVPELLLYFTDNQVKIECTELTRQKLSEWGFSWKEGEISKEQIGRRAEEFYAEAKGVFEAWERQCRKFDAHWEFGLVEYASADLEQGKESRACESSVQRQEMQQKTECFVGGREGLPKHGTLPQAEGWADGFPKDYACVLEGYLKKDDEYVINRKGEAVSVFIPYIQRTRSYQIGEELRFRKVMDEGRLKTELENHLALLAKALPRHKYHTEKLELAHELRAGAGRSLCAQGEAQGPDGDADC